MPRSSLNERKNCKIYILTTEPEGKSQTPFTVMASDTSNCNLSIFCLHFVFTTEVVLVFIILCLNDFF